MTPGFDPARSLADSVETVPCATVIPWADARESGFRRAAAVLRADGTDVPAATCWRDVGEAVTFRPRVLPPADAAPLAGRWLYGGLLYAHFGHFLCESTARLWALDHAGPVDGVLFLPKKRMQWPDRLIRSWRPFLAALGLPELPVKVLNDAVEVEALVVPEQGFGVGQMAAGRPEFRRFMTDRLSRIPAEGPPDLYISRSRLMSRRGTILAEERLEALLEAQGYHVFHPQEHPVETQIARYRAARRIVSMDASPLHLAAFVVRSDARVAILNRAPSRNIEDYVRQFRWTAGLTPDTLDTIDRFWFPEDQRLVRRETIGLMDYGRTGAFLADHGYIADARDWRPLTEAEVAAAVAEREARLGLRLAGYTRDAS
jgi:capsular polysaccharide biosynthesis protein